MNTSEEPIGIGRAVPAVGSTEAGPAIPRPGSISLPSERKVVTILFADTVESTRLIEALDPEEAWDRLGPVIQAMVGGIHQYGGTVIRSEGDAIVALFGAPHAYEDHAVRACHAAMAILRRVAELNDPALKARVALNSGEVMVRPVVRDVSVEYEVTGMPMHIASRVEKLTRPGSIYATRATAQLVEGLVATTPLGLSEIRGLTEPVDLFEVSSLALSATPWDARLARGLTPFVGRAIEKNVLWNAAESARAARGQLIELIGEAGVGKSRLIYELVGAPGMADFTHLAGGSASYAQNYPYFSFRNLFGKVFGIVSQDDDRTVSGKLAAHLAADPSLAALVPAFRALLGLAAVDATWMQLDPIDRRRRTIAAARDFIFHLAQNGPVLCILEDLQWMDEESRATLEHIVQGLDNARILVCVTSRTGAASLGAQSLGAQSLGAHVGNYTRIPIQPLHEAESLGILDHLLDERSGLAELRRPIAGKAQGNPLFLEELARMLTTSIEGRNVDPQSLQLDLQVPNTIQSVIAARIDRLPAAQKQILQIASVVGNDVPASVLERLSGIDTATLEQTLLSLTAANYLVHSKLSPDSEYSFYHALTHEVAYRGLLKERRRALHAATYHVFAELHEGRTDKIAELLARHAELGGLWERSVLHLRQGGVNAIERSAYKEAISFLERALEALAHLPATTSRAATSIELRLRLRIALGAMGEYRRLYEHLALAEEEAILLNDKPRLGAVCIAKVHVLNMLGSIDEAILNGRRACELARDNRDSTQSLMANYFLAQAHEFRGDYAAAAGLLTADLTDLLGVNRHTRFGMTGTNAVLHLSLLSHIQAYLGAFSQAEAHAREACAVAQETGRPYDVGIAHFGDGIVKLCRGRIDEAIASLETGWQACTAQGITALLPMIGGRLGFAYAVGGQVEKGAELLDHALQNSASAIHVHCWSLTFSGWCEHRRGASTLAFARQHQAVQLARQHGYRGIEVWAKWLLGMMLHEGGRSAEARDVLSEAATLAKSLGMRLHAGHCYGVLADICGGLADAGRSSEARAMSIELLAGDGELGRRLMV